VPPETKGGGAEGERGARIAIDIHRAGTGSLYILHTAYRDLYQTSSQQHISRPLPLTTLRLACFCTCKTGGWG
jgi:hypothetical protein